MAKSSLIGRIAFDLVANTGKLLAPLKKAEAGIASLTSKANRLTGIGAAIAAPLSGMLTAGYAISKVTKAFDELGAISDESKRLGIPAEALSRLQYTAKQAGVETTTLGKSLQYMMKKGFSVNDLGRIANELDGSNDPVRKMQKALEYFGRGGGGMINVLEGGAEQLHQMAIEADALGYTVSQFDADAVEAAGDSWARIGLAIDGLGRKIAVELAPYVDALADGFVSVAMEAGGMGKAVGSALEYIVDIAATAMNVVDNFLTTMKSFQVVQAELVYVASGFTNKTARNLARRLRSEVEESLVSPGWGDEYKRRLAHSRAEFEKRIRDGASARGGGMSMGGNSGFGALIRGSQEAFSAIISNSKEGIQREQLTKLKKINANLGRGVPLVEAGLE